MNWNLYHGTSSTRLSKILAEDCLRCAPAGDRKISLTPDRGVAAYFAGHAIHYDVPPGSPPAGDPVILTLDANKLWEGHYPLVPFSDTIWGDRGCDWECEIEVWDNIQPLLEYLIKVDPAEQIDLTRRPQPWPIRATLAIRQRRPVRWAASREGTGISSRQSACR